MAGARKNDPGFNASHRKPVESNHEKYEQLNHPLTGILDFEVSNFDVSDNSGLKLLVHTPLPGTDTVSINRYIIMLYLNFENPAVPPISSVENKNKPKRHPTN